MKTKSILSFEKHCDHCQQKVLSTSRETVVCVQALGVMQQQEVNERDENQHRNQPVSGIATLRPSPYPTATPRVWDELEGRYGWEKEEKFYIFFVDNLPSKT